jgi:hypothetical protein
MFQNIFSEHLSGIRKELEDYVGKRIELLKLELVERLSKCTSSIIVKLGLMYFLLLFLMFLSLAGGFYIGELLHSNALGFLIIAGFYLLLAFLLYIFRSYLVERPVIRSFIKLFFKSDKNE